MYNVPEIIFWMESSGLFLSGKSGGLLWLVAFGLKLVSSFLDVSQWLGVDEDVDILNIPLFTWRVRHSQPRPVRRPTITTTLSL